MLKVILLSILLSFTTLLWSEEHFELGSDIGIVVALRGECFATNNRVLGQGSKIYLNDVVVTDANSFTVIQLDDGSKVTIRPNSQVTFNEYEYNGNSDDRVELGLLNGGLRIITGAIAKSNPENYKVNTPVALMGVRGTEFAIMLCGESICTDQ